MKFLAILSATLQIFLNGGINQDKVENKLNVGFGLFNFALKFANFYSLCLLISYMDQTYFSL